MTMGKMTRAIRRTHRRIRPKYLWTGFNLLGFTQGTSGTETVIVDPAIHNQTMAGFFTLEAIRLHLSLISSTSTAGNFSAYILDFDTDETETVVAGMPAPSDVQDIELVEKKVLWQYRTKTPTLGGEPLRIEAHIKTRRNLKSARAVIMRTDANSDTNTVQVQGVARCLLRIA